MLVLFACFDFASVTVVLLNLSSVFSCVICLLQPDHAKDAWVARSEKQHFDFKSDFCFITDSSRWLADWLCGQGRERARAQPLLSAALHTYDV